MSAPSRLMRLIHVKPTSDGAWGVHLDGCAQPTTVHGDEIDAERAARRLADLEAEARVVLHDRYARPRRPSRGAPPAQARRR